MYYPIGWHKVLNLDTRWNQEHCNVLSIQASHDRELFFILTSKSIHVWYSKPAVEIVCHRRSQESIDSVGNNKNAVWKTDSSVIVVATDQNQLLFYQLRPGTSTPTSLFSGSSDTDTIYRFGKSINSLRSIVNCDQEAINVASETGKVPAMTIFSFGKLDLTAIGISCLIAVQEELVVGANNGDIYGIHWNGNVDDKFPWSLGKKGSNITDYIRDMRFSSMLSGFVLVFNSGLVGFMSTKTKSEKTLNGVSENSRVNYLKEVENALFAEVNHRYRLVALGLNNSKVLVCNLDDLSSSLVINHELQLSADKFPHGSTKLGPVKCMRYSPDSFALTVSWENGDFAIWSVFGSLLFCSQQWRTEAQVSNSDNSLKINHLEWGREGYNLWMNIVKDEEDADQDLLNAMNFAETNSRGKISRKDSMQTSLESVDLYSREEVIIVSVAHSNLTSNPHLTCSSDSIVLMSEERLYIGPGVPNGVKFDHWFVVDLPSKYMNSNYPIRYATVDRDCKNIAIAGKTGFSIYSIENDKWNYFTKTSHESSFSVVGDIIWWKDYLVASCYNSDKDSFELRAYTAGGILDYDHCIVQPTRMGVVRMSIFENRLLVLYGDGTLGMFMLNVRMKPKFAKSLSNSARRSNSIASTTSSIDLYETGNQSPKSTASEAMPNHKPNPFQLAQDVILQICPIENLIISNLQANPHCISSIALTRLHFKNNRSDDSILLNACGKLFLLERQAPIELTKPTLTPNSSANDLSDRSLNGIKSKELEDKVNSTPRFANQSILFAAASLKNSTEPSALTNVTFKAISVIATNVEQFWISPEISKASEMSFFRKALWLYCGGANNYLQVWLPLLNDKNDPPTDLYVPDRIMLPIKCDIYPLAIRSSASDANEPDDAIVLGAESEIMYKDSSLFTYFPINTVKRQCRVYLHRILRELLLNQHLGYYAKKIAESCQSLPYFAHCFELLLHEVLEEEATSPVPLPDPMLPQVVRFIKEFPVYLETVVHCARKSELSMWSHLFDERAVGNPRRLFQACLEKRKLDTAASCLIILQSLDRNIVSQRMVKELIKAAKNDLKYNYLIQDLENFLNRAEIDYMSNSNSCSSSPNA